MFPKHVSQLNTMRGALRSWYIFDLMYMN